MLIYDSVIIPRTESTIKHINSEFDELDRKGLSRLRKVKGMKERSKAEEDAKRAKKTSESDKENHGQRNGGGGGEYKNVLGDKDDEDLIFVFECGEAFERVGAVDVQQRNEVHGPDFAAQHWLQRDLRSNREAGTETGSESGLCEMRMRSVESDRTIKLIIGEPTENAVTFYISKTALE
ncbi:H(+)-transporting V1 sector ATPase subunit D [Elasticomyces elasticus]|nr:H(+)-transporting V1 sector ATPase subunit D [Elasticomyces elasticus]